MDEASVVVGNWRLLLHSGHLIGHHWLHNIAIKPNYWTQDLPAQHSDNKRTYDPPQISKACAVVVLKLR